MGSDPGLKYFQVVGRGAAGGDLEQFKENWKCSFKKNKGKFWKYFLLKKGHFWFTSLCLLFTLSRHPDYFCLIKISVKEVDLIFEESRHCKIESF